MYLTCCSGAIPYLGLLAIPLGIVGIILSGIGFLISIVGNKSTVGFQIAGCIICFVGIFFAFHLTQTVNNAAIETLDAIDKSINAKPEVNSKESVNDETSQKATNEDIWCNASDETMTVGDIEVEVTKVVIGKVESIDRFSGDHKISKDKFLQIYLSVHNNNQHKKYEAWSWGHDRYMLSRINDEGIILEDNYENSYDRAYTSDMGIVDGGYITDSLYPDKTLEDVLVFQVPVDGIKFLRLKLSAKWIMKDEEGFYYFKIPASMIQRK